MNSGRSAHWRIALDHHQRERSGQHRSSAPAARGRRSELRGDHEHAVLGGVEPHVARPLWRLYVLDDAILVRRVLMNYGERAVRIGGKRVARGRIETSAIDASADRDRGHHLAGLIVGY